MSDTDDRLRREFNKFMDTASIPDMRSTLRRYEWLIDFVMLCPNSASTEEQSELWRRTEVLRNVSNPL